MSNLNSKALHFLLGSEFRDEFYLIFLAETEAAGAAFHLAGKFGKAARDARAMLIEASVFRPTARLTGGPRRTRISHLASLPYPSQQPSPSAPLRFEFELQLVRLRFFWLWLWL